MRGGNDEKITFRVLKPITQDANLNRNGEQILNPIIDNTYNVFDGFITSRVDTDADHYMITLKYAGRTYTFSFSNIIEEATNDKDYNQIEILTPEEARKLVIPIDGGSRRKRSTRKRKRSIRKRSIRKRSIRKRRRTL
jgi:hypothetical protein